MSPPFQPAHRGYGTRKARHAPDFALTSQDGASVSKPSKLTVRVRFPSPAPRIDQLVCPSVQGKGGIGAGSERRSPGRRSEAVSPDDIGLPVRLGQLQAVGIRDRDELGDFGYAGGREVGDVTEEH